MKTRPRASPRNRGITAGGDFHPALRVLVCFNVLTAGVKGRRRKFPRFWRVAGRGGCFFGENTGRDEGRMRAFLRESRAGNVCAAQGRAGLGNRGPEWKRESAATLRRLARILSSPFSLQSRLPLERGRKIFAACLLRRPGPASRRYAPPQAARQAPEQKNACQNRKKGIYSPTNIKSG